MTFYNIIFWQNAHKDKLDDKDYYNRVMNHESIHEAQMEDFCKWLPLGGTIFYIIYFFDWLWRVLFQYPFSHQAYRNICFEQEAYKYEYNMDYLKTRKKFTWKGLNDNLSFKVGDSIHIVTRWKDLGWHEVKLIIDGVPYVEIAEKMVKVNLDTITEINAI